MYGLNVMGSKRDRESLQLKKKKKEHIQDDAEGGLVQFT